MISRIAKIDVLVSEALHLYDDGDVADDGGGFRYSYPARATVRATDRWVERFRRAWEAEAPGSVAARRVFFGKLLAGGARIESATFRNHLVGRVPQFDYPIVGGEMEAAGVAAVCADGRSGWIVIKGLSDFATAASRAAIKETRVVAAQNAASFTLDTLMRR